MKFKFLWHNEYLKKRRLNKQNVLYLLTHTQCAIDKHTHIPHSPSKQSALSHSLHNLHLLSPTVAPHCILFLWLDLYTRQFPTFQPYAQ